MTETALVFGSSVVGVGLIVVAARTALRSKSERRSWGDPKKGAMWPNSRLTNR